MGKPSPPPPPDYTPVMQGQQAVAASSLEAAQVQAQVAREQMAQQGVYAQRSADVADQYAAQAKEQAAYGRQQYENQLPYLNSYMQGQLDFQGAATANEKQQQVNAALAQRQSEETYNRYMTDFAPRETQFAQEAFAYGSPARQEADAAAARGDVATAFSATKDAATRQLMSYGVDPSQGAYGRTQAMDISKAASLAAAGTMARKQTEMQGKQLETAALEIGQKLPAQAVAQAGLGTQQAGAGLAGAAIGGGGLTAGGNLLNAGTNAMGSPTAYAGLSNPYTTLSGQYGSQSTGLYSNQIGALNAASGSYTGMGNAMNSMYSNQLEQYKAQAAQSPWGAIGGIAGQLGAAAIIHSDRRIKKDITPYQHGLDEVLDLNPVMYSYNGEFGFEDDGRTHVGLVAQDVESVLPEMVGSIAGVKALDYSVLIATLVNAVKELTARVAQLEGK